MDKGWRRCGEYYYKPDMEKSCCQLNTIRLEAEKYKPNKKQRKIMNRFNRYLLGTYEPAKLKDNEEKKEMQVDTNSQTKGKNKSNEETKESQILNSALQQCLSQNSEFLQSKDIDIRSFDLSKLSFTRESAKKKNSPTFSTNALISL